jgi:hypothetical protein
VSEVVYLKLDTAPFMEALALLKLLLHVRYETVNLPIGIFEAVQEFFRLENHGTIRGRAGELWISLKPTEIFREFIAAVRAGKVDLHTLVDMLHANPFRSLFSIGHILQRNST